MTVNVTLPVDTSSPQDVQVRWHLAVIMRIRNGVSVLRRPRCSCGAEKSRRCRRERRCMLAGMRHRSPRRTTFRCTLHILLSPRFAIPTVAGRPATILVDSCSRGEREIPIPSSFFVHYHSGPIYNTAVLNFFAILSSIFN